MKHMLMALALGALLSLEGCAAYPAYGHPGYGPAYVGYGYRPYGYYGYRAPPAYGYGVYRHGWGGGWHHHH